MLYIVAAGDTLTEIAQRFETSVPAILTANVFCSPNLIFAGQALIIPEPGLELPRAGGSPYYVLRPGDTLWCLAQQFNTTIAVLARANNIPVPDMVLAGRELLIVNSIASPEELYQIWANPGTPCEELSPLQIHGIYYQGSFQWEALGATALPYLLRLIKHPCAIIRAYAALSLGRIGLRRQTVDQALSTASRDADPTVRRFAALARKRIQNLRRDRRLHIVLTPGRLYQSPSLLSSFAELPAGTAVAALQWHIPSPTGEEGPRGGVLIYDRLIDLRTGRIGYLPRVGFNEIPLV